MLCLARLTSIIFSPLVWVNLGLLKLFWQYLEKGELGFNQFWILVTVNILFPLIFFLVSVKRKHFDFDLSHKEKRFRYFIFSLACAFVCLNLVYYFSDSLFRIMLALIFTGLAFALVTFWDKISLHVGGFTAVFMAANLFNDWRYFYFAPIIIILAWSRVMLKKHTICQVVEGFLVPVIMIPIGFFLLNVA